VKHPAKFFVLGNMRFKIIFPLIAVMLSWLPSVRAADLQEAAYTVDGVERTALIYAPPSAKTSPTPVVFVFHGHGGNSRNAARSFHIEKEWPEAIVVYPQGLKTSGVLVDPEGKFPGWEAGADKKDNRDLKFFDAMLAQLKKDYNVDAKRIYSTGHSHGGYFTYLLWLERSDVLAAVAPCAASAVYAPRLSPKPALHIAGEKDPLVKFEWQRRTMDVVRKVNGCAAIGQPWAEDCTLYPSAGGTPLMEYIHPGGHIVPAEAPSLIVKFFKEH
jgi:polyhydroxybutyrate depolymerase